MIKDDDIEVGSYWSFNSFPEKIMLILESEENMYETTVLSAVHGVEIIDSNDLFNYGFKR